MKHATIGYSLSLLLALGCSSSNKGGTGIATGGGAGAPLGGGAGVSTGGAPGAGMTSGSGGMGVPSGGGTPGSGAVGSGGTVSAAGGTTPGGGGATSPGTGGVVSGGGLPATGGASPAGGTTGTAGSAGAGTGGAPPAQTCLPTATLKPGETTETITVGGMSRQFILHVPASYTGKTPVPLVTDWHALLTDMNFEKGNSGYLALSESEGFIVAWPNGINNAWNIGPCCTMSRSVDDLGFAKAIVQRIESEGCVDTKRVYATGYSMGGGMSHYLGCNAADIFATVVPSAFDLLQDSEEPCHPARPITVMSFRGSADPIVPYAGGASNPPNGLAVTIHFLGAQGTFQKWAMLDHCTDTPADSGNGCMTYSKCDAGVQVTLCTATGGGHVTGDAKLGWAMMKAHPMP